MVKGNGFHNQREQLLKKLLDETPLEIWTNTIKPSIRERLFLPLRQAIYDFTQTTKHVPSIHSTIRHVPKIRDYVNLNKRPNLDYQIDPYIASRSKPALYGLSMYQQLYQSKCTLNTHIDLSAKFASNMRLFEATGIGTCLLTELQDNLPLLFKPDTEVVTYQCADEAVEKVLYLLKNDNEQKKIAEAGKRRTLKDHTFDIRAQQMDQLIYDYLRK